MQLHVAAKIFSAMADRETFQTKTRTEWRRRLTKNHSRNRGIWLVTFKKDSGMRSLG